MKIGLIGNGNIAKIIQKEFKGHDFIILDDIKNIEEIDLIIITKPMFVFINEYFKYKKMIDKTDTLFIPGNALNKQFFEAKYPKNNISFSFNTPYIGRFPGEYYLNDFKMINLKFPESKLKEVFKIFNYFSGGTHLSNLFLHPLRLEYYGKNEIEQEKYFYDFRMISSMDLVNFKNELMNFASKEFDIEIIDPFKYYDSCNPEEFKLKLLNIKSLNNIKIFETKLSLCKNRYFLDDIMFKLNYIVKKSKTNTLNCKRILAWAKKIEKNTNN